MTEAEKKEAELTRIQNMWNEAETSELNTFARLRWQELKRQATDAQTMTKKAVDKIKKARSIAIRSA